MPFWLPAIGGYTELGSRVVVLGLAAMSLNFLLGFTGVLSFGHAAYFGLGAYGAGMTIKYLVPSTPLGIVVGMLVGTLAARHHRPADRAPARRLFRDGDDRLRPGVLFHRLPLELGDRRRRRALPAGTRQPLDFGFATIDILHNADAFYYFVLVVLRPRGRRHGVRCCARRSAARCSRSARTSGARAFSAFRSTGTSGCRG